jgi:hypothetical protein
MARIVCERENQSGTGCLFAIDNALVAGTGPMERFERRPGAGQALLSSRGAEVGPARGVKVLAHGGRMQRV